ncbi:flagellar M-ring protein FliF [Massilia sp. Root133]|uniref:Flagellar M-ring protein n=1 Tax=Massilia cellulosiltytica TaxID=2683234 RepID=A0A7X3G543_9BURK|nr:MULTISPECIES: flagellar basal-body MS-ring/collar protein FliF [Telluria group]KQX96737.1 flagellar M-ring protein FliF [Massilia sp. Root133]KQZ52448.1 flagellar M-ring protein FliF [Massilia sp. Root1485]MVW63089.1 flagellar basal body M-ring protein FliF [Telluria cellulosilytica]
MATTAEELLDSDIATPADEKPKFWQTTNGKRIVIGGAIAGVVAIVAALWLWTSAPEYKVLFSNYTDKDGGAITASLDQMGVKYKFSDSGSAILVPADRIHDLRLKLAQQGLPRAGNVGFELLENQKLGTSQFVEQVNYQRSLEGELANSIQSLSAVSSARVHLALPKPSVFVRDQQKPTASVLLNLQPGRALDQAQVSAIVHLVASSIPELTPANVTVVDQNGTLLSDSANKNGKQLDPNQLKYVEALQQNIVKQVQSIIAPLVGQNNVRAEATAEVDFAQTDTAAEMYKPNSPPEPQAIRSQQTSEQNGPGSTNPSGIPGALSNQPPGVATAPLEGGAQPAQAQASTGPSRKDSTTNYEVDKTIRYEQKPMGGIKRLTVGVVVNYRRTIDPKTGKVVVKPLSAAEVAQINELVKQAMGYSQARGDTLNVTNAPFDGVDKPEEQAPDWWKDPANLPLAKDIARYVFIALVLAFLWFRFVRPLLKPAIKKFDEAVAIPPEPEPEEPEAEPEPDPDEEARIQREEEEQQKVQVYKSNLEMAKDMAKNDPRIVANVIKEWLGTE